MRSLKDALRESKSYLQSSHIANFTRSAEDLLASVLQMKKADLYLQYDRMITNEEEKKLGEMLARRASGEPIQYILNEMSFFFCDIHLSKDALIPRQETELLVEHASNIMQSERGVKTVFDICCGTGCIAIAIKKQHPHFIVYGSDLSAKCIALSERNAKANQVDVAFLEGDLLTPFKGKRADFVFCNPPYISEKEYEELEKEVKDFEPRLALVGGEDGLAFYKRLATDLPSYLNPGAKIFLEIGHAQSKFLFDIFSQSFWKRRFCGKDLSGHDRFFFLEIE